MEDAIALGVVAYVLNVGTVELRLPTFRDRTSRLYAHQRQVPLDVLLYNGVSKSVLKRQNEAAEALFVRRFATGLRVCTRSKAEVASLVDWYREKQLPAAVNAVPAELRVNERVFGLEELWKPKPMPMPDSRSGATPHIPKETS